MRRGFLSILFLPVAVLLVGAHSAVAENSCYSLADLQTSYETGVQDSQEAAAAASQTPAPNFPTFGDIPDYDDQVDEGCVKLSQPCPVGSRWGFNATTRKYCCQV
jgi:hypothetical protein